MVFQGIYIYRLYVHTYHIAVLFSQVCVSSMEYKEGLVVIIIAFVIHIIFAFDMSSFLINNICNLGILFAFRLSIGVSLLLFPVFGFITDVYLTRYRMLQLSLLMILSVPIAVLIYGTATILVFPLLLKKYLFPLLASMLVL